jgi:hypothetical protein
MVAAQGIMVGDGERVDVACDPLSIPLRAATLLNTPLMYQTFPYACLAHIPKNCAVDLRLTWLPMGTSAIRPLAVPKAMTRLPPLDETIGL